MVDEFIIRGIAKSLVVFIGFSLFFFLIGFIIPTVLTKVQVGVIVMLSVCIGFYVSFIDVSCKMMKEGVMKHERCKG